MRKLALWAPIGGALCLIAAAFFIGRSSRRDMKEIYSTIDHYDKLGRS
ncbi:MAG: hypothetical protein J6R92_02925 [Akkermansia sp.]|nr:hypothetical protein [Akkermansia sp.]